MSSVSRSSCRAGIGAGAAALVLVALSACSTPPWEMPPSGSPQPAGTPSAAGSPAPSSVSPAPAATGSTAPVPTGSSDPSGSGSGTPSAAGSASPAGQANDLARGSTRRTVSAGEPRLTIDYWSTLSIDQWSAEVPKPLSMAVSASLPNGANGRGVFLTRVSLTPVAQADRTVLGTVAVQEDTATVEPGYDVLAPRSYQQVFVLPGVDPTATSLTLTLTYELLVETTATSDQYAKQTGQDTITIALT